MHAAKTAGGTGPACDLKCWVRRRERMGDSSSLPGADGYALLQSPSEQLWQEA